MNAVPKWSRHPARSWAMHSAVKSNGLNLGAISVSETRSYLYKDDQFLLVGAVSRHDCIQLLADYVVWQSVCGVLVMVAAHWFFVRWARHRAFGLAMSYGPDL